MIKGKLFRGDRVQVLSGKRYVYHRFYRLNDSYGGLKMRCGKSWSAWTAENRSQYIATVCQTCERLHARSCTGQAKPPLYVVVRQGSRFVARRAD